ncbi:MAG TPA: hypothetical protein VEO54_16590 [Thermoanaerobaculia bacterium]|nr:hypothetical protein [Thermoanaerobaculia bacterium]
MSDISKIRPEFRRFVEDWFARAPWIHAIGIGKKIIAGRPIEQDAITFFVSNKVPNKILHPDTIIQSWIEFPGLEGALPTDVVAMPPLTFSCTFDRPAHGGDCIAPLGAPYVSTLGAVLKRKSDAAMFILSASHAMLGIGGTLPIGQTICHPIGNSSPIARVTASTSWSTTAPMIGDVALAEVLKKVPPDSPPPDVEQTVKDIGSLTGVGTPAEGDPLRFRGRNGLQSGNVFWTDVIVKVDQMYRFENTFLTNALAQKGDSGALAVNNARQALGVVFADNGILTACTELNAVASELSLNDYQWF